ncbi:N-acyl amino acid synthase FeeM domain-containing protein [Bradyrhizobium oligotrophicum]|uniref:N-acyl amino acid synthase FeeM domain-containing protein n=1 Tax=Bradyrhizobium oligotrophicum TaxID=44255 RepID=UPI003EC0D271
MAEPEAARQSTVLPYATVRLAYVACEYFNANLALVSVQPEHQAFCSRVFMYQTVSEPRSLPDLKKAVVLMELDYPAIAEKIYSHLPFLRSTAFEQRMLFDRRAAGLLKPNDGFGEPSHTAFRYETVVKSKWPIVAAS